MLQRVYTLGLAAGLFFLISASVAKADTFYLTAVPQFTGGYSGTGVVETFGDLSASGPTVVYSSAAGLLSVPGGGYSLICPPGGGCTVPAPNTVPVFKFDLTLTNGIDTYTFNNQDLTALGTFTISNGLLTEASINATDANGKSLKIDPSLQFEIYGNQMTSYGRITSSLTAPVTVSSPGSPGPVAATPEPSSLLLLATGLLGAGGAMKRRFWRASGMFRA